MNNDYIKQTVQQLFMAERYAASVEDHLDSIGLAFQPYSDMDMLLSYPLMVFETLFTLKHIPGKNIKEDISTAFTTMENFKEFWSLYGTKIIWRRDNG